MGAAKIAGSGFPTATGEAELASLRHRLPCLWLYGAAS